MKWICLFLNVRLLPKKLERFLIIKFMKINLIFKEYVEKGVVEIKTIEELRKLETNLKIRDLSLNFSM